MAIRAKSRAKLTDLDPVFTGLTAVLQSERAVTFRTGTGIEFDCPCEGGRIYVQFANPLDGGEPKDPNEPVWRRRGSDFEGLSLRPSVACGETKWCLTDGILERV